MNSILKQRLEEDEQIRNQRLTFEHRLEQVPEEQQREAARLYGHMRNRLEVGCVRSYMKGRNDIIEQAGKTIYRDCAYECDECPMQIEGQNLCDFMEGNRWN